MRDGSNVLRAITRIRMRDATNVLRTIQRIRMRDASNVLRVVYQYLSVSLSATTAYGVAHGLASSGPVTTATSITVTVSGGTAPFTYAWQFVSGDLAVVANTPAAATTSFGAALVPSGGSKEAVYQCKVTDTNGATITTDTVTAEVVWIDDR